MVNKLLNELGISADEQSYLSRYDFDDEAFLALQKDLADGRFATSRNQVSGEVAPPEPSDLLAWPQPDSAARRQYEELGNQALAEGAVAIVILNGGMATRFGGRVKGIVDVTPGRSFLGYRLADIAHSGHPITVFLMSSFATEKATGEHLREHDRFGISPDRLHCLTQKISVRLTQGGELFRDAQGAVSFYAPGHGDLFDVLAGAPEFHRFAANGGKMVTVGNVDNLGATVSPVVLGAHLAQRKPVTVEVAARAPGDKGGAPARWQGRVQVLEGFRFPSGFAIESIPVFSTNTMVVDASSIRTDYKLTWFRAEKEVGGTPVVQFERLMGEVTSFVPSTYLTVPREGADNRFLPVKTPQDLESLRPVIAARLSYLEKT